MALDAYTAGPSAQTIVAQVELIAGSPALNLNPSTKAAPTSSSELNATAAYVWLNELLTELYTTREWPFLETAANLVIAARENALPTDFWRTRFPDPLIIIDGTQRRQLAQLSPEEFFSSNVTASPPTGPPNMFMIDKNRSSFFVNPIPDKSYNAELHYVKYIPRLTAITDVPLFPHSSYLIQAMLAKYYQHQNDDRYASAQAEAAQILQQITAQAFEERDTNSVVPFDNHHFIQQGWDTFGEPWLR